MKVLEGVAKLVVGPRLCEAAAGKEAEGSGCEHR